MSKQETYSKLVADRKDCKDCMADSICKKGIYKNQSEFKKEWDTDHIGNLSTWAHDLEAEVLIVGQDYCDAETYERDQGRIQMDPITDLDVVGQYSTETNYHLRLLVKELGLELGSPEEGSYSNRIFLTNAILCMKPGKINDPNPQAIYKNCITRFLHPLIELVQPKAVITLGKEATRAVLFAYLIEHPEFKTLRASNLEVVLQERKLQLNDKTFLFPVCHPGNFGRMYRKKIKKSALNGLELQKEDWRWIKTQIN